MMNPVLSPAGLCSRSTLALCHVMCCPSPVPHEPPQQSALLRLLLPPKALSLARLILTSPILTQRQVLRCCTHNGFPVFASNEEGMTDRRVTGLVLRSQLLVLLRRGHLQDVDGRLVKRVRCVPPATAASSSLLSFCTNGGKTSYCSNGMVVVYGMVMVWYGMAWHGMAWHGMAWYGMVWYGVVWYGMVWCGMVWYGVVWCGMVWHGMVWHGMAWHGMAWHGMVWHGMVWCGMVWYGMVWYGMVWYGMVWCGMVWHGGGILAAMVVVVVTITILMPQQVDDIEAGEQSL